MIKFSNQKVEEPRVNTKKCSLNHRSADRKTKTVCKNCQFHNVITIFLFIVLTYM